MTSIEIYMPEVSKANYILNYLNFNLVFLETIYFSWKPFKSAKSAKSSVLGLLGPSFVLNAWFSIWPRKCRHDLLWYQPKYEHIPFIDISIQFYSPISIQFYSPRPKTWNAQWLCHSPGRVIQCKFEVRPAPLDASYAGFSLLVRWVCWHLRGAAYFQFS